MNSPDPMGRINQNRNEGPDTVSTDMDKKRVLMLREIARLDRGSHDAGSRNLGHTFFGKFCIVEFNDFAQPSSCRDLSDMRTSFAACKSRIVLQWRPEDNGKERHWFHCPH